MKLLSRLSVFVTSSSPVRVASVWASRALLLGCLFGSVGAAGCAAENKITKGPHFSLNHPDFWKVQAVASKAGEPTTLSIGKYSETVINEGTGATNASAYEASQADVEVRIFTWPGVEDGGAPAKKVGELLYPVPDLQLQKSGRLATDKGECGTDFTKKYIMFKETREPMDLLSRPGFRTIIVGSKANDVLYGVLARVPFEIDQGLYCHNLRNMQTQLQLVLEGLTPVAESSAAPAATATAPGAAPPGDAGKAASGEPPPPK